MSFHDCWVLTSLCCQVVVNHLSISTVEVKELFISKNMIKEVITEMNFVIHLDYNPTTSFQLCIDAD